MKEQHITIAPQADRPCEASSTPGVVFNQHPIWDQIEADHCAMGAYQEAIIKAEVESPSLAVSYAQAIVCSWRSMQQQGALRHDQPCYLLELEAGNGHFASLVLEQLQRILSPQEWFTFNPQYLLSDSRAERISDCWQHPSLRHWIERGNLEPVQYNSPTQRHIDIKSRRLVLGNKSIANPLIVIANGVFSGMRQSLYNIHYGKCFSAQLTHAEPVGTKQIEEGTTSLFDYHWLELDTLQTSAPLISRYLRRLDSGLVLVPEQVFTVTQHLNELTENGILILSSDRGFHGEHSLREQWIPEMGPYSRYFLPLNGHALSWHIESQGGNVTHFQSSGDYALQSAVWCPSTQSTTVLDTQQLEKYFANGDDTTVRRMAELANHAHQTINVDQLLALLQISKFDHHILFAHFDCLFESLSQLEPQQRLRWRDALQRVWQQYYTFSQDNESLTTFGLLAMRLGAWSTAKESLSYIVKESPELIEGKYYLAVCLMHLGELDDASLLIQKYLRHEPSQQHASDLSQQLNDWTIQCQNDHCYDQELCRDKELSLHPLAAHYAEEFLYQYRDPSIAVMTSLPNLTHVNEFEEWRQQLAEAKNKGLYALVHRDFGFIGVLSLNWHRQDGFFYFWVGTDYQSQGYGRRGAQLLFRMATLTLGVQNIYTCVFDDNSRSRSTLTTLGFDQLPFKAKEPDDAYVFFTNSRELIDGQYSSLINLLVGIESPIKLQGED